MLGNLEALVSSQYDIISQNGRQIVSASVQGKQFTYDIPDGYSVSDFQQMLQESYSFIKTGGASAGQMTDSEMADYVTDANNEVTSVTRARFSNNSNGNYYSPNGN